MRIRRADERGRTEIGWLQSRHTFSFGDYRDPAQMGFRSLRVINDDVVAPGQGFGTHGHRDMEIISIVLSGALAHRDSLGHGQVLRPGEVQVMSAGTGIEHSEFNPSPDEPAHFLQVWIRPAAAGRAPAYDQRAFPLDSQRDRLVRVAGPERDPGDGALRIGQDADVYLARLTAGGGLRHVLADGRGAWLHVIRGSVRVEGTSLAGGDAAAWDGPQPLALTAESGDADILLFDLK